VIVGTVALSLGASVGISVLVWQHLVGIELYWVILPLAVILLLTVGSDYNLLRHRATSTPSVLTTRSTSAKSLRSMSGSPTASWSNA
jgi:uncharacterized membrane protein YdfJ with MMPL/SSD domain